MDRLGNRGFRVIDGEGTGAANPARRYTSEEVYQQSHSSDGAICHWPHVGPPVDGQALSVWISPGGSPHAGLVDWQPREGSGWELVGLGTATPVSPIRGTVMVLQIVRKQVETPVLALPVEPRPDDPTELLLWQQDQIINAIERLASVLERETRRIEENTRRIADAVDAARSKE